MFPPDLDPATAIRTAWAAHGMSVVELAPQARGPWRTSPRARLNRRITLDTTFAVDGPGRRFGPAPDRGRPDRSHGPRHDEQLRRRHHAVGHRAVRRGELQPVLPRGRHRPAEARYGLGATQDTRNWRSVDPRWDATTEDYRNEPNRFGWIVEIDPTDPAPRRSSTPRWVASSTRAPT